VRDCIQSRATSECGRWLRGRAVSGRQASTSRSGRPMGSGAKVRKNVRPTRSSAVLGCGKKASGGAFSTRGQGGGEQASAQFKGWGSEVAAGPSGKDIRTTTAGEIRLSEPAGHGAATSRDRVSRLGDSGGPGWRPDGALRVHALSSCNRGLDSLPATACPAGKLGSPACAGVHYTWRKHLAWFHPGVQCGLFRDFTYWLKTSTIPGFTFVGRLIGGTTKNFDGSRSLTGGGIDRLPLALSRLFDDPGCGGGQTMEYLSTALEAS